MRNLTFPVEVAGHPSEGTCIDQGSVLRGVADSQETGLFVFRLGGLPREEEGQDSPFRCRLNADDLVTVERIREEARVAIPRRRFLAQRRTLRPNQDQPGMAVIRDPLMEWMVQHPELATRLAEMPEDRLRFLREHFALLPLFATGALPWRMLDQPSEAEGQFLELLWLVIQSFPTGSHPNLRQLTALSQRLLEMSRSSSLDTAEGRFYRRLNHPTIRRALRDRVLPLLHEWVLDPESDLWDVEWMDSEFNSRWTDRDLATLDASLDRLESQLPLLDIYELVRLIAFVSTVTNDALDLPGWDDFVWRRPPIDPTVYSIEEAWHEFFPFISVTDAVGWPLAWWASVPELLRDWKDKVNSNEELAIFDQGNRILLSSLRETFERRQSLINDETINAVPEPELRQRVERLLAADPYYLLAATPDEIWQQVSE